MRILAVLAVLCFGWAATAQEARVLPGEPSLEATIQGQIDAFLVDDFGAAFDFASPMIQQLFGSSENFGSMVRNGYPMVWRPSKLTFLDLRERGGLLWQQVLILDGAGQSHVLEYQMIPTQDGWRINGVSILQAPGVGA
ncbi:MAG: DUF4864 domain-containing protein [Boseongicola sp.]|nr:MAG: DUF4864 domain-containing protein [Boseongicola sp.]